MNLLIFQSCLKNSIKYNTFFTLQSPTMHSNKIFTVNIGSLKSAYTPISVFRNYKFGFYLTSRFRSFFGFLKPKLIIIKARFNLLKFLKITPRNHALSRIIRFSKRYTSTQINQYLRLKLGATTLYTDLELKMLANKFMRKQPNSLVFNLYRHKIFNYTTPKRQVYSDYQIAYIAGNDFRQVRSQKTTSHIDLNATTISLYNWKIIT